MIPPAHATDCLANRFGRARALAEAGDEILRGNNMRFYSGVANQSFPLNRDIGGCNLHPPP